MFLFILRYVHDEGYVTDRLHSLSLFLLERTSYLPGTHADPERQHHFEPVTRLIRLRFHPRMIRPPFDRLETP